MILRNKKAAERLLFCFIDYGSLQAFVAVERLCERGVG